MNVTQLKDQGQALPSLRPIVTASPHEKALNALIRMKKNQIHHLPVVSDNRLVGMVSDRDIFARALSIDVGDELSWLSVGEAMKRDVPAISENSEIGDILKLMLKNDLSALPIVNNGVLRGIVTESDILALTARMLESHNKPIPGVQYLTNPLTQKILALLSDIGI